MPLKVRQSIVHDMRKLLLESTQKAGSLVHFLKKSGTIKISGGKKTHKIRPWVLS